MNQSESGDSTIAQNHLPNHLLYRWRTGGGPDVSRPRDRADVKGKIDFKGGQFEAKFNASGLGGAEKTLQLVPLNL